MRHYCTLFDKNYLAFGMALHESMQRLELDYTLHALAMDDECAQALEALDLPNVKVIRLNQVLTGELRNILETMSFGQVCWTCQPLLCEFLLETGLSDVTYLEADSYFYSNPEILFEEIGDRSISLVPHNYAPEHDQTSASGIYCVQFNFFKNNAHGRQFLSLWRAACMQYNRNSPHQYPGQTCLNSWPQQSPAVCVIKNPGAGVAPWNQSLFNFTQRDGTPQIDGAPVVFYHFHQLSFIDDSTFHVSSYRLRKALLDIIYRPYAKQLTAVRRNIRAKLPGFNYCKRFTPPSVRDAARSFKWKIWKEVLRYARDIYRGSIIRVN